MSFLICKLRDLLSLRETLGVVIYTYNPSNWGLREAETGDIEFEHSLAHIANFRSV
jgi:hypothetical protein